MARYFIVVDIFYGTEITEVLNKASNFSAFIMCPLLVRQEIDSIRQENDKKATGTLLSGSAVGSSGDGCSAKWPGITCFCFRGNPLSAPLFAP
jgi:hypothetical protein